MRQKQAQRTRAVFGREQAVGAMSKGLEWLDEARQELLAVGDRRPTVAERERIVDAVEGRIEADLARRKEALGATSSGSVLLRKEEDGAGGAADSQLQSFAEREAVLARIEDRAEEELEAQEEALRSIPFGKQYVSEAEQARAGGAEEPPSLAERESMVHTATGSMVHTATGRVEEEFDRREKRLAGVAGNENLLVEVAGGLDMAGGTLTLGERWRVNDAAERRVEQERAKLEGREAALLEDPAGAVFLSDARREILGDADREANTLADRGRVIQAAEVALQKRALATAELEREHQAALRTAMAATQAAAGRSGVELHDGHVRAIYATGATHESGLTAVERTTAALAAAADQQLPTETVVEMWNANMSAPGEIAVALEATTAEAREQERQAAAQRQAVLAAATAATQAAAGRSGVKLRAAAVHAIYETGETHESGLTAVERTTAALAAAADQQLPTETVVETWNANMSAPGEIAVALEATTAEGREQERQAVLAAATAATQAAAGRSGVKLPAAAVHAIYKTGETHESGLTAVERTTAALAAAADQQLPTETVVEMWNANMSAPGEIAVALEATTAEAREQERQAAAQRQVVLAAATAATQAAAGRSGVKLPAAAVHAIYETGETHESGLTAVERTTAALVAAADQQLPAEKIIDTWRVNESEPGKIAATLHRALAAKKRVLRLEQVLSEPAKAEAFIAAFSRPRQSSPDIDWVLDLVADRRPGRRGEEAPWHALVLEAEQQFPGVSSTTWRKAGAAFTEPADTDRDASSVSQKLSARALARALAAEEPEPPPAGNLEQQRVIEWLWTQITLAALRTRSGAGRLAQRNRNARPVVETSPPVPKPARMVPDATLEDVEPLFRAMTDLEKRTDPSRLEQRARHAVTTASENTPPVVRPRRLVPDATRDDIIAAAQLMKPAHNKLFERRQLLSRSWTTVELKELPAALAKSAPAWTDEAVEKVTWLATRGVGNPERTLARQIADAHLDDYENQLPEQYEPSAEWRSIRSRAEEAVWQLQDNRRYKRADRNKDDRRKREFEAAAINRACGRDARRLHKKMVAAREAARPDWEVAVKVRAVLQDEKDRHLKLRQEQRAREEIAPSRPAQTPELEPPTRNQGQSRGR